MMDDDHHRSPAATHAPGADPGCGGLLVSAGGFTLRPSRTRLPAGEVARFELQILGDGERPVESLEIRHGRPVHLVVVRRDFAHYQHLHPAPVPGAPGLLAVDLVLPAAGFYRAIADFAVAGRGIVLGVELAAAGELAPLPELEPVTRATAGPYVVELDLPRRARGPLSFTVLQGGAPVADLEPHLEARGHLVCLREGDLSYVHAHAHAHPSAEEARPGVVSFHVDLAGPARHRLFFEFAHGGRVHTAAFAL